MFQYISIGGVVDSLVAGALFAVTRLFYSRYKENKRHIEHLEKDVFLYINKNQKVSIRRDFTSMMMFDLSVIKHQQLVGYFLLLLYFVMLYTQLIISPLSEISTGRWVYLSALVIGFLYFHFTMFLTDKLLFKIERKCAECYSELLPEIEVSEKA